MADLRGGSKVGAGSYIGDHAIIGHPTGTELKALLQDPDARIVGATIGRDCTIRDYSVIYSTAKLGDRVRTGHFILVREGTTIGAGVLIGTSSVIDNDCRIGADTSIQTGVYIPTGSRIGKGCFLGPNATLTNDKRMLYDGRPLEPVTLADKVRVGANSTILPGVRVGKGAVIGAGAVVTKDVRGGTVVAGVPARVLRKG